MDKKLSEDIKNKIYDLLNQGLVANDILEILKQQGCDNLPSLSKVRSMFKEYSESKEGQAAELDSAWF